MRLPRGLMTTGAAKAPSENATVMAAALRLIIMTVGLSLAGALGGCSDPEVVTGVAELGPVALTALDAPVPVEAEGEVWVVYELRVSNPAGNGPVRMAALTITAGSGPVATYPATELQQMLNVLDLEVPTGDIGRLVFVWLSFPPGQVPATLTNTMAFADTDETRQVVVTVTPRQLTAVKAPLEGAGWVAVNISNETGHRRAIFPESSGDLRIPQRFAIDWVKIDESLNTHVGDSRQNENYYAYGQPVLAVADGRIVQATDGIPDNVPPTRAVEITLATLGGNNVTQELGDGTSAFYAHMIPGSVRVAPGDEVQAGDTLGLVGNSGNSDEPHLHIHFARIYDLADSGMNADGLPFLFESFEILGNRPVLGMRFREMPLNEAIVRFD